MIDDRVRTACRAGAIGLALIAGISCRSPSVSDTSLAVTLSTDAETVSSESPVTLTIVVTNLLDDNVLLYVDCAPNFDVVNNDGNYAGPPRGMCTPQLYQPLALAAGASHTLTETWSGRGAAPNSSVGYQLAPGQYELVARIHARAHQQNHVYSSAAQPIVVTAPAQVTRSQVAEQ